ncbi:MULTISPECIES: GntR family transcriptional regulator [unclassified Clostridium]|mgnify:CR=1 FL=1|jgi:DNA-binding GntR family transcriptional regulator|uniref:GntR family transcriptional regulator n=1 Tax=unclassified Clostridium TaxID=2614128 RepID=UPI001105DDCF|nr:MULTISPECIES: GntR family transcriptional regulator [unclassified Clostridium]
METEKTDSLSEIAYRYILEQIISFTYKPNDPILENEICRDLNISRTPLREALRRLEAEGFVTKARNRGTFVRAYTVEDIIESCDIRKLFEVYSLRNCVKNVSQDELQTVKKELQFLKIDSTPSEYYKTDSDLHNMITRYCMSTRMRSILASLSVQLDAFQKISAQTPNRLLQSKEEHLNIVEAIEKRDLELATTLLESHLENVKESSIRAFQKMRIDKIGI